MSPEERATLARVSLILSRVPASNGVMHAGILLDPLIGVPGTPERREAFKAAHAAQAEVDAAQAEVERARLPRQNFAPDAPGNGGEYGGGAM